MKQYIRDLTVKTRGKGLWEVTGPIVDWASRLPIETGMLSLYIRHTSASLTIQENADPDVVRDLKDFFERLVPEDDRLYRHTMEGPDDMPAHIRAALTQTHLSVPLTGGRPALGTWQGIYVFEHRRRPHHRTVVMHAIGQ